MITDFIKIKIIDYKLNEGEDLTLYTLDSAKNIVGAQ